MFVRTSKLIKHIGSSLVSRETSKIVHNNSFSRRILLNQYSSATITQIKIKKEFLKKSDNEVTESDMKLTNTLISSHSNAENIQWSELEKKLSEQQVKHITSTVFKAVSKTKNVEAAISYYKYLTDNNGNLTVYDLMRFCKLISDYKKKINNFEEVIRDLYEVLRPYVLKSVVIRSFVLDMVSEVPDCLLNLIELIIESNLTELSYRWVVAPLKIHRPDLAFTILKNKKCSMDSLVITNYASYMMQLAKDNKFYPSLITDLADACETKSVTILYEKFHVFLAKLVKILNNSPSEYTWSISQCSVDNSVCSNCSLKLIPKPISQSDLERLRHCFVEDVVLKKKEKYLSTSDSELNKFMDFLANCKPYNLVLDGLNILYQQKINGYKNFTRLIKYFIEKNFKVLLIARKHTEPKMNKIIKLQPKDVQNNIQFFFVENASDDDLFVILAALKGNSDTYYLSGDLMTPYGAFLDMEVECIFSKWKLFYRYTLEWTDVTAPEQHLGLPQLTHADENSYTWHLSYVSPKTGKAKIRKAHNVSWVCLKAVKK